MSIKRLCSIGLLNIKLNLILKKSFAKNNNFNINDYNKIEDLEHLFHLNSRLNHMESKKEKEKEDEDEEIDYTDYISLSSDDNLLNTLFYINRAYKVKTFIEFLIPNEIKFNNKFIKSLINEILCRNYFFVVENNIINKSSKIKFIIKILDDDTEEIISKKEFDLNEENEDFENDIFCNEFFDFNKLSYDFSKNNFFFIDLDSIKSLQWKTYNDLSLFILKIIQKYNKLKIILSLNENSLTNNYNYDGLYTKRNKDKIEEILFTNKRIIEFSDIIFCFKNSLNNFLKEYSIKTRTKILKINVLNKHKLRSKSYISFLDNDNIDIDNNYQKNNIDLIVYDNNKYRKNIPRLTVILDCFDYLTIYNQEFEDDTPFELTLEPFNENFCFSLLHKHHTNKEFKDNQKFLSNNSDKCLHIFIGGFLSRYINNTDLKGNVKSYDQCFIAGNLLLKNSLILLKNNIDYITDIDQYNVVVKKRRKCLKERLYKQRKEELRKIRKKEEKFILDCTNSIKSRKKDYNSLLDFNCTSYLSKKNNLNHLAKFNFISKDGEVLKDPGSATRIKSNNKYNKLIKIDNAYFYNTYNKLYNSNNGFSTPLLVNKIKIEDSNRIKSPKFKKLFESYDINFDIKNTKNNIYKNNSITKKNFTNSSNLFVKTKINSRNMNSSKNNKINFKKVNLYLKKRTYDRKKEDKTPSSNRNSKRKFDSTKDYLGKYYNAYLYKLYQPKKTYKAFLNFYGSNLKIKK